MTINYLETVFGKDTPSITTLIVRLKIIDLIIFLRTETF